MFFFAEVSHQANRLRFGIIVGVLMLFNLYQVRDVMQALLTYLLHHRAISKRDYEKDYNATTSMTRTRNRLLHQQEDEESEFEYKEVERTIRLTGDFLANSHPQWALYMAADGQLGNERLMEWLLDNTNVLETAAVDDDNHPLECASGDCFTNALKKMFEQYRKKGYDVRHALPLAANRAVISSCCRSKPVWKVNTVLRLLMKEGFDVNQPARHDRGTVLHTLAGHNCQKAIGVAVFLKGVGADVSLRTRSMWDAPSGVNPIHELCRSTFSELDYRRDPFAEFELAREFLCMRGASQAVRQCIGKGVNALHLAAGYGKSRVVELLLQTHRDLARTHDDHGRNACHYLGFGTPGYTTVEHRGATLQALLDVDPSLSTTRDKDGNTPLHAAAYEERVGLVEGLLARTPAPDLANMRDNAGKTALDLAYEGSGRQRYNWARGYLENDDDDDLPTQGGDSGKKKRCTWSRGCYEDAPETIRVLTAATA